MAVSSAFNLAESEAIRLAQQGDGAAFEHLYRLHSPRVYSVCRRLVDGNTAQAEELTQDAFLQLFRKIRSFRGDSAFSTWLHRLAVNTALMRLRRKTHIVASIDEMNERHAEADGQRWEPGGADLELAGVIDRLNLERAIGQLPPGSRAMFVLHEVEGYEHEEIAALRGCTVGNSKSQLHKARVRLRQLLHEATGDASRTAQPQSAAPVGADLPAAPPKPRLPRTTEGRGVNAPSRSAHPELRTLLPARPY